MTLSSPLSDQYGFTASGKWNVSSQRSIQYYKPLIILHKGSSSWAYLISVHLISDTGKVCRMLSSEDTLQPVGVHFFFCFVDWTLESASAIYISEPGT